MWMKTTHADYYVTYVSRADATTSRLGVQEGSLVSSRLLSFHFRPHTQHRMSDIPVWSKTTVTLPMTITE